MANGIADFESYVYSAAKAIYDTSREPNQPVNVSFGELNFNAVYLENGDLDWDSGHGAVQAASKDGTPTQQVAFDSTFVNNTNQEQEHTISAKAVRSTMSIKLRNGAYFGEQSGFGVQLPLEDEDDLERFQAAAAIFGSNVTLGGQAIETKHSESTWSTDDKITVPPHSTIRATITVNELHHATTFTLKTTLKGKVSLKVTNPAANNAVVKYMQIDIYEAVKRSAYPTDVITLNFSKKSVTVSTMGFIDMRYGIDKQVHLEEE